MRHLDPLAVSPLDWQIKSETPVDLQAQLLEHLRRKMKDAAADADAKVAARPLRPPVGKIEDFVQGFEAQSLFGRHFEAERSWSPRQRHGTTIIGDLNGLPPDLFDGISNGELRASPPESWLFLDTETTGLAGGSGTCAFLIGVGRITPGGFRLRQFFMRDYGEESSQLHALREEIMSAELLITYNGRTFDVPLLESRYRMTRSRPPFEEIPHLDLLHGARRLWRLRFESCKLTDLEQRILGHSREEDVPGELIPEIYFDFLRTGRAARLAGVFLHNALDIVSLACLAGVVPWAFRDPAACKLSHGAELVSLGRWLRQSGRVDEAVGLFQRALKLPLSDELMFRTIWDLAEIEKKRKAHDAAVALLTDLAACRNPHRVAALEELAKHYEHREKSYAMALEFTETAIGIDPCPELLRRRDRLKKLAAVPVTPRLL